jgi:hypothetical protein
MAEILNYQPLNYLTISPSLKGQYVYGELPIAHYDRYINRIILNSVNLGPSDLGTPSTWTGPQSQTIIVQFRMGILDSNTAFFDGTQLGDLNVAEYVIPILIPKETSIYVLWEPLLAASLSKVSCTFGLSA